MTSASTRPTRDRLRRTWYLLRLDLAMQGYPAAQRKEVHASLRAELEAAADEVGTPAALAQLGSPRRLAEEYYAQLDHPCPRILDGAVVALLVGLLILFSWFSYALGSIDTLTTLGGGRVELSFLAMPVVTESVVADGAPTRLGLGWSFSLPAALLLLTVLLVTFAIGARLWRGVPTRAHPQAQEPA
ncbi:HAAS signaling domain-containing protein [Cellulomonas bogoriensis]|uniref:Uncharacterized protein n=1 Tax=Cellulomonas bogoriensis 69B4 = DSM 16987 TaxID=1386082 RepID=A0A0A0BRT4_9CELL|nr:hypothetical protein [Cellulomonas bogoriensis]KGM10666.1 hypothetical protein N869_04365 [Cellulomonas bogoriensis 69B4 = DSM 16987]